MSFEKHDTALVYLGSEIGEGSTVGAYSIVNGATIDRECQVGEHVVIAGEVRIARRVRIGPHVCISAVGGELIRIQEDAVIGPHSTICPGVVVGCRAVIQPGAVVTKTVPAAAVVSGNPARIVGYSDAFSRVPSVISHTKINEVEPTSVNGVTLHRLPMIEDLRGNLSFGENSRHLPFEVKRYFLTFDVSTKEARGEHAHRTLQQFLICVHGRVHIAADDGSNREEFRLDRPDVGIYLPPMVWGVQYRFSAHTVLLGLCSAYYDPADYIRDYSEFLNLRRG